MEQCNDEENKTNLSISKFCYVHEHLDMHIVLVNSNADFEKHYLTLRKMHKYTIKKKLWPKLVPTFLCVSTLLLNQLSITWINN